ncbi:MAG: methionyl-tRNA formyltransferase [Proteobacteria bacterium]|nr:methionyl-tRNA formyltransferase [Pseudomonadota bacterium]
MRIALIGQAAFGAKTLETLVERGENVVAVYTPPDGPGGRLDPLKQAALDKKIPVYQPSTYKDDRVLAQYREMRPDLAVLAFVTDIIPRSFFESPTKGAICYHPSLLPRHRGASAINWAVMMGDAKTGLTIFWPDDGIDTGPILLQKEVAIGPDDTTGSLYFDRLFPMGVEAIAESVALIRDGKAPKTPQPAEGATYEPPCDDRVAAIDWDSPAQTIHNLVRGCDPQPGAYALWKGEKVRMYGAKLLPETADAAPGTIVAIDSQGAHLAVKGGTLVVGKVRAATGGKVDAAAFAAERGAKARDRFDS